MAETDVFILTRQNELFGTSEALRFQWTLPGVDFLQNDTTINDLEDAMEVLKKVKGLPIITADTITQIKTKFTPFYKKPLPTATVALRTIALILILSLLAVVFWQAWRTKRRERQAADPVIRFKELIRKHDNINSILGLLEKDVAAN